MPVTPRLTTGKAPVTVGAKPAPAPAPAARTTTTAPQAMAKSFGPKYYAKGGSASARADGIAQRGKTKGTNVVMCGGGMAYGKK
jgi:hypothetical protein